MPTPFSKDELFKLRAEELGTVGSSFGQMNNLVIEINRLRQHIDDYKKQISANEKKMSEASFFEKRKLASSIKNMDEQIKQWQGKITENTSNFKTSQAQYKQALERMTKQYIDALKKHGFDNIKPEAFKEVLSITAIFNNTHYGRMMGKLSVSIALENLPEVAELYSDYNIVDIIKAKILLSNRESYARMFPITVPEEFKGKIADLWQGPIDNEFIDLSRGFSLLSTVPVANSPFIDGMANAISIKISREYFPQLRELFNQEQIQGSTEEISSSIADIRTAIINETSQRMEPFVPITSFAHRPDPAASKQEQQQKRLDIYKGELRKITTKSVDPLFSLTTKRLRVEVAGEAASEVFVPYPPNKEGELDPEDMEQQWKEFQDDAWEEMSSEAL